MKIWQRSVGSFKLKQQNKSENPDSEMINDEQKCFNIKHENWNKWNQQELIWKPFDKRFIKTDFFCKINQILSSYWPALLFESPDLNN